MEGKYGLHDNRQRGRPPERLQRHRSPVADFQIARPQRFRMRRIAGNHDYRRSQDDRDRNVHRRRGPVEMGGLQREYAIRDRRDDDRIDGQPRCLRRHAVVHASRLPAKPDCRQDRIADGASFVGVRLRYLQVRVDAPLQIVDDDLQGAAELIDVGEHGAEQRVQIGFEILRQDCAIAGGELSKRFSPGCVSRFNANSTSK